MKPIMKWMSSRETHAAACQGIMRLSVLSTRKQQNLLQFESLEDFRFIPSCRRLRSSRLSTL